MAEAVAAVLQFVQRHLLACQTFLFLVSICHVTNSTRTMCVDFLSLSASRGRKKEARGDRESRRLKGVQEICILREYSSHEWWSWPSFFFTPSSSPTLWGFTVRCSAGDADVVGCVDGCTVRVVVWFVPRPSSGPIVGLGVIFEQANGEEKTVWSCCFSAFL